MNKLQWSISHKALNCYSLSECGYLFAWKILTFFYEFSKLCSHSLQHRWGQNSAKKFDYPHLLVSFLKITWKLLGSALNKDKDLIAKLVLKHPPLFLRATGLSWIRPFTILDSTFWKMWSKKKVNKYIKRIMIKLESTLPLNSLRSVRFLTCFSGLLCTPKLHLLIIIIIKTVMLNTIII